MQYITIDPGETLLILCHECDREFTLTLEPKSADMKPVERIGIEPAVFKYCPFCGSEESFQVEQA